MISHGPGGWPDKDGWPSFGVSHTIADRRQLELDSSTRQNIQDATAMLGVGWGAQLKCQLCYTYVVSSYVLDFSQPSLLKPLKTSPKTGPESLSLCSVDQNSHKPDQIQGGGGTDCQRSAMHVQGRGKLHRWAQWHPWSMRKCIFPGSLHHLNPSQIPPLLSILSTTISVHLPREWWPHLPSFCSWIIVACSPRAFQKTR